MLHHSQEAPANGNGSTVDPVPAPMASLPNKVDATEGSQLNVTDNGRESLGCKVFMFTQKPSNPNVT